ncbi:MAG: hypothetical protein QM737_14185 [Ferruginibacter sp.]
MNNKLLCVLVFSLLVASMETRAQLNINNAIFTVEAGAVVTVQGNLSSNADIGGGGRILMKGTTLQTMNMNGFSIPNLEIDNNANVSLTGEAKVGTSLLFTHGKIQTGNYNLTLSSVATTSGQGAVNTSNYVETNGTGQLRKTLTANVTNFELPVGGSSFYEPVFITTNGTYGASAYAAAQAKGAAHPNKHPRSTDYLNCYWPVSQSGITGTLRATGKYTTHFVGVEADMRGVVYAGGDWNLANGNINTTADTAGSLIPLTGGDLYAMNRFVLLKDKVFLQGAYNTTTGLMNDNLRTLATFPTTDPYRSAPYNAYFTHTTNTVPETIASPATVLGVQPSTNNNIVDWVFIELRNNVTPGNAIIQTRSALLQRDGDIVDIDGVSPVYFKNVDASNYTITVRHRNHLGLSTNPSAFTVDLNEKNSTPGIDMTTASGTQLLGVANTNYAVTSGKNLLYAGNVSGNGIVRYQGTNGPGATNVSDRIALLTDLGNNEINTLDTYQRGDVSMNGITRYQGTNGPGANNVSDRIFILGTVLGNNEIQTKAQVLPN